MSAPFHFLLSARESLLEDVNRVFEEVVKRDGVATSEVLFGALIEVMASETPDRAAAMFAELLLGSCSSYEAAMAALVALRRVVFQRIDPANQDIVTAGEELFERAMILFARAIAADQQRIQEHNAWVFARLPAMMHSIDAEGRLTAVNERWLNGLGYTREEVVGRRSTEFLTPESAKYAREVILPEYFKTGRCDNVLYQFVKKDGSIMDVMLSAIADVDPRGRRISQAVLIDVTERLASEREAHKVSLQEELIRSQQEMLRAISTPLVPLGDGILLMPLVGNIDSTRADQIMAVLLEGVVTHSAEFAILDVTGVPSMDASVAEALMNATKAVGLLGAQVILTGIGPSAAHTLVELGVDLGAMTTKSTLRAGLAVARKRLVRTNGP
jgi:PAS domain S-box-containing protein